jgi:ABC-type nitrate/sulfonate/bicarbonate transport system substrate-binding protein
MIATGLQTKPAETTRPSVLWYTRCPVPTAASIAIERGLLDAAFHDDGIAVRSLNASDSRVVRESHFDHTQPDSFRQGGNIPPVWTRSRGGALRLIGLAWVDEYQAMITLPGSGIRNVRDLRGRRIAIPRRVNDQIDFWAAMTLRTTLAALSTEGMDESDVELVDLPVAETYIGDGNISRTGSLWGGAQRARRQQAETFALIRGEVDAIHSSGAGGAYISAYLGAHEIIDIGRHPDRELRINNQTPSALTVSSALADEHPDLVRRFVECLVEAAAWARDHAGEVQRIVAGDVTATPEWVAAAYGAHLHERLTPFLSEDGLAALAAQKAFLLRHGFIDEDFDLEDWVDRRPLEALGLTK